MASTGSTYSAVLLLTTSSSDPLFSGFLGPCAAMDSMDARTRGKIHVNPSGSVNFSYVLTLYPLQHLLTLPASFQLGAIPAFASGCPACDCPQCWKGLPHV